LTILQRIRETLGFDRPRARISVRSAGYDGAAGGRRWRGQGEIVATLGAMNAGRAVLARRARALVANNPLAASAVEAWVSALVGTGLKPQSTHPDAEARAALNLAFEAWTDVADADRLTDLYGLQAIMVRRMVIEGEAFALMIDGPAGLRLRLIDAEQVDASVNRDLGGGARIVQGVEFDAAGTRVAYHILPDRPGLPLTSLALTPHRVPAENVIHLFRPEAPGQVRGVSWLAPVMVRLADLDQWRDAQLMRQKIAAMFVGFLINPGGETPDNVTTNAAGGAEMSLEPGTMKSLEPGFDVKFSTPASIGVDVIDFAKITEREISVGMGLPAFVVTGDLSQVNYSSARTGLVEWRRRVEALQHGVIAFQVMRPVWRRWATIEVLSGRVASTVDAALPVRFITPKQQWVDPRKDVEAELAAIAGGLMSRREAVTSRGVDIEALDAEIAADNARAKELGLALQFLPLAATQEAQP